MSYKYDRHKYVEDSTKGKSVLDPKSYKRDVLMQVWLQSRYLATLLKWLDKSSTFVKFRSDIVQIVMEQVVHHLVDNGEVEMVEFATDAQSILSGRFGAQSNPSGRGGKNAYHNLVLDERRKEKDEYVVASVHDKSPVKITATDEHVAYAAKRIREFKQEETKREAKEQLEKVLANTKVIGVTESGEKILESTGRASSVVFQEDKDKLDAEQTERDKLHKEEKERRKIEKQIERLQEKLKPSEDGDTPLIRSQEELEAKQIKRDEEFKESMKALDKPHDAL